jgi:hypothetical protein
MPDWLHLCGARTDVERQIGNAVPYTLAAEVAASVWEAATGAPAARPPDLTGPSLTGAGLPREQLQAYEAWRAAQGDDWNGVIAASRAALGEALHINNGAGSLATRQQEEHQQRRRRLQGAHSSSRSSSPDVQQRTAGAKRSRSADSEPASSEQELS